jgi:hypothetical protein
MALASEEGLMLHHNLGGRHTQPVYQLQILSSSSPLFSVLNLCFEFLRPSLAK